MGYKDEFSYDDMAGGSDEQYEYTAYQVEMMKDELMQIETQIKILMDELDIEDNLARIKYIENYIDKLGEERDKLKRRLDI